MVTLTIDGRQICAKEGQSVLHAALDAGIYIPHLCDHPDLEAKGGCRLCSVSIDGKPEAVPSCMTKVSEGMVVTTRSEQAEAVRKMAMELMLSTHPADCTGCPKFGKCELQSIYQYMGVSGAGWRNKSRVVPNDNSNPLISHLFTRCVRCGRCIRACQELRGVKILDYVRDKSGVHAGIPGGKRLSEAGCRFCGACIEVCPTGSIVDAVGIMKEHTAYADNVVPCRSECPAHINIPEYLRFLAKGDYANAQAVIRQKVPFPETLGRVCVHTCETACKRGKINEPLSVCRLKWAAETYGSEEWKEHRKQLPATGKKVAVVGAGPCGLTAAYYLAKQGHSVTVFEKNQKAGGQCRYGIPAYRLPDDTLDREIASILEVGIELRTGVQANPSVLKAEYDSVFVATGTHCGTRLPLEGSGLSGVYVNTDFLKAAREGSPLSIGQRVMVLGGGSVAYDCARTALRLGAKEVHIACLEAKSQMTASADEILEGGEEGVILHDAHSFLRITGTDKAEGVELQKVAKFCFDENRRAVIDLMPDTKHIVAVDTVIFAVGQRPEGTDQFGLELTHGPYVAVNANLQTSVDGIFAGGDVVTGTKSVILAIEAGRKAAKQIDLYLGGDGDIDECLTTCQSAASHIGRIEGFADLTRREPAQEAPSERIRSFDAYTCPLSCQEAQQEASRCLQCDLRLQLQPVKLWTEYGGGN